MALSRSIFIALAVLPAKQALRGGEDCGALREAYAAALARARACAPGAADACGETRPAALDALAPRRGACDACSALNQQSEWPGVSRRIAIGPESAALGGRDARR